MREPNQGGCVRTRERDSNKCLCFVARLLFEDGVAFARRSWPGQLVACKRLQSRRPSASHAGGRFIVAMLLLVYLPGALLRPERF